MVKKMVNSPNLFKLENIVGILLAILIVFDLKVEQPICKLLNTNFGKLISLVIIIILIVLVHPIVGILFLIYLYQCINNTGNYSENSKLNVLHNLNPQYKLQVEEEVILNRRPIKNQNLNNNVEFVNYSKNVGTSL